MAAAPTTENTSKERCRGRGKRSHRRRARAGRAEAAAGDQQPSFGSRIMSVPRRGRESRDGAVGRVVRWLCPCGTRGGKGEDAGPGAVFCRRAGIAIGQVWRSGRGSRARPVLMADPAVVLAGRADLLAEMATRLTGGDGLGAAGTVALGGTGRRGEDQRGAGVRHRHWRESSSGLAARGRGTGGAAADSGLAPARGPGLVDTRNTVARCTGG